MALQGVPRSDIARRVDQAAGILRIGPLLAKGPSQLSGGEKQRAAIARGLLKNANIFILDDPLVGLDFKLRESLMEDLKDMRAEIDATFLYITSDPLEALTMAERLVVLDKGRLVEAGPVDTVYYDPKWLRTIELVGFPRCNVLPGRLDITNATCATAIGRLPIALEDGATSPEAMVAIRPEDIAPPAAGVAPLGVGKVTLVENLGSESVVYVQLDEATLVTTVPARALTSLDLGYSFPLAVRPGGPRVFDRASGRRIGRVTSRSKEMRDG
jgi:ABC-type sugar transport system ATPase subunit